MCVVHAHGRKLPAPRASAPPGLPGGGRGAGAMCAHASGAAAVALQEVHHIVQNHLGARDVHLGVRTEAPEDMHDRPCEDASAGAGREQLVRSQSAQRVALPTLMASVPNKGAAEPVRGRQIRSIRG